MLVDSEVGEAINLAMVSLTDACMVGGKASIEGGVLDLILNKNNLLSSHK